MSTLTIATSIRDNSLALSMSTVQVLSETKEALTQRVDALRAELQALHIAHQTTIASLQAEQNTCDLSITDQQAKNGALQIQNNELRGKVTRYQTALIAHQCPNPKGFVGAGLNADRAQCRQQGQPTEKFLELLKPPVVTGDPLAVSIINNGFHFSFSRIFG
ncbi:MAG: hypothetical protein Q8L98_08710 [Chlamydiales bacterium]|nr:hypothetical protein [Chlamydiales bacterium]